ncbi:hypothetical protein HYT53_00720 [Candidatus Woesearchaeota archaeon]|nr:hypothetical protein [Candidatus Woesearchaeota archaeon]
MQKKQYFKEPSLAQIVRGSEPVYVNKLHQLVEKVVSAKEGQHVVLRLKEGLVPESYGSQRKFLKHGDFVRIPSPNSVDEAADNCMAPWILRQREFDSIDSVYHAGYSFKPFADFQDDKKERRVRLAEHCDALRILSYGLRTGNNINIVEDYSEAGRVSKDGATIAVSVPSRTKKSPRYNFNMYSVVMDSNDRNKYAIANGFWTDIKIPVKRWAFRYNYYSDKEDSNVINIFAPEIAAYFKFMMQELHKEKPNVSVAEMSPFGVPTNLTIGFYKRLLSQVVVHNSQLKNKHKLRKLNKAEQEIMLWALVKEAKYELTFFRRLKSRDGPIENLDWTLLRAT